MEGGEDDARGPDPAGGPQHRSLVPDGDAAADERYADAVEPVEEDGADQHGLEREEALRGDETEEAAQAERPISSIESTARCRYR